MRMILAQVWQSIQKNISISFWTVLLYSASIFIIAGVGGYIDSSNQLMENFKDAYSETTGRVYFSVRREMVGSVIKDRESYTAYLNFLSGFQAAHPKAALMNANVGDMVFVKDYNGPYQYGYDYWNMPDITVVLKGEKYYRMNGAFADSEFMQYFDLQVSEGKNFSDCDANDFVYGDDKVYPVVLGSHFRGVYQIDDIIQSKRSGLLDTSATNKNFVYRVIGFLREGAALLPYQEYYSDTETTAESRLVYLDDFFIFPQLDMTAFYGTQLDGVSQAEKDARFLLHFTVVSNHLFVFEKDSEPDQIISDFMSYASENGLHNAFSVRTGFMKIPHQMYEEMDAYFKMLIYCGIFIAISSVICISTNLINKTNKNMKKHSIHLLCGAKLSTLRHFVLFELLVLAVISNAAALIPLYFLSGKIFTFSLGNIYSARVSFSGFTVLIVVVINLAIIGLSLIFPIIKINVTEPDRFLRGKD